MLKKIKTAADYHLFDNRQLCIKEKIDKILKYNFVKKDLLAQ